MAGEQKRHARKSSRGKRNLLASLRGVFLSQYREWVAAVRFLTVLPVPGRTQLFEKDEAAPRLVVGVAYFPLVGLLLAGLLWSLVLLLAPRLPQRPLDTIDIDRPLWHNSAVNYPVLGLASSFSPVRDSYRKRLKTPFAWIQVVPRAL